MCVELTMLHLALGIFNMMLTLWNTIFTLFVKSFGFCSTWNASKVKNKNLVWEKATKLSPLIVTRFQWIQWNEKHLVSGGLGLGLSVDDLHVSNWTKQYADERTINAKNVIRKIF